MKLHKVRIARKGLALICAFVMILSVMSVYAEDIESLEEKTSDLQDQLNGINQELLAISDQIADTEEKIDAADDEIFRLEASLRISRNNEERQYDNMKTRIKYMYENGNVTLLSMLFNADSMSDFLNKADFIQNITEYDREMLENLVEVREGIEVQETELQDQQESLDKLKKDLDAEQAELQAKATATSTDLETYNAQLQALREEQARQAAEAQKAAEAKAAAEEAAKNTAAQTTASTGENGSSNNGGSSAEVSTGGGYTYPSGNGVLTPSAGRVTYNGHTETYYSQKVLPGGGLDIPGRHVASDGTIRDSDGYICVASDDYPKGTIVETSLGTAKVYDTGSGSGNIDIYTDW
jgi:peptidoglycan hydrolase CwlO-like protein